MDDDLALNARERYGYIYAKEKIFFDFTKFSRGIFSKDWTERFFFAVSTGLQGAGTGADVPKSKSVIRPLWCYL